MSSEWPTVRLGDHCDLVTGFPFKSSLYTDEPHAVRLLRGDNIGQGRLEWNSAKRLPLADTADLGTYWLQPGDVVLAMDRPWITAGLKYAKVRRSDCPSLLVQRVARMRPRSTMTAQYLHSLIASPDFTQYIQSVTTGTAVPHISASQIREFKFCLPCLEVQREAGLVLDALDDRIALLRETNATLEAIAQALFKSWFVDFDPFRAKSQGLAPAGMDEPTATLFPGKFVDTQIGRLPAGWAQVDIGHIADVIDCLHSKKPELLPAGRPFLQLSNIRDDGLLDTSKLAYVSDADYAKWTSRIEVASGDCVITNVGRVGAVSQIPIGHKAAMGRNMTAIRLRSEWPYPTYLIQLLLSDFMRSEIQRKTDVGTILDALNVRSIPRLLCVVGPHTLMRAFESTCRPIRAAMELNLDRANSLAHLRDTLLPRLITGQLRMSEAEAALQAH